jgi:GNAT superfamily N-acetyltransferase
VSRLEVRHLEPKDYAPLIEVVNDWWGGRAMRDMLPKLFFVHFRPTSFAAELDDRLVGFLCGFVSQTSPETAYAHFIGVDPLARGSAVGRALYERFFEAARSAGCREVLAVTSPANVASVAFHRKLGFDPIFRADGDKPSTVWADYDGPGEHRVWFRRNLDQDHQGAAPNPALDGR